MDEHRERPDRRSRARGGRREGDGGDFSPLVLLVGDAGQVTSLAEAVLAKLRFAVSTSRSVDDALRVLSSLRPDIVAAGSDAAGRIRMEAPEHLPVVVMTEAMSRDPELLIEEIRNAVRGSQPSLGGGGGAAAREP